jgi:hypothetical protein
MSIFILVMLSVGLIGCILGLIFWTTEFYEINIEGSSLIAFTLIILFMLAFALALAFQIKVMIS